MSDRRPSSLLPLTQMRLAVGTLTLVTGLLITLGLTMLHSIGMHHPKEMYFFYQQSQWLVVGMLGCVVAASVDYRRTRGLAYVVLVLAIVLLALARTPGIAKEINGAYRWLKLGPVSLQPSELAKLGLIMAIAAYGHTHRRRMSQALFGMAVPGIAISVVLGLVLFGKDLGTTALLAGLSAALLFAAGSRLTHLVPAGLAGVVGLGLYLWTDPVRWRRVEAWLDPAQHSEAMYQSIQSKIAIGSGGVEGRGLGNGVQVAGFVPEQPTDFIFSVIGEELGLRVTLPLVAAYLAFGFAALAIARRAPDSYGALLACGVGLLVGFQAAFNVAVTTASMPNKGLALPFVSYGGSCLVVMLTLVGLLISVAKQSAREEFEENLPEAHDREAAALQHTG